MILINSIFTALSVILLIGLAMGVVLHKQSEIVEKQ